MQTRRPKIELTRVANRIMDGPTGTLDILRYDNGAEQRRPCSCGPALRYRCYYLQCLGTGAVLLGAGLVRPLGLCYLITNTNVRYTQRNNTLGTRRVRSMRMAET
jgi:hypothetical protein